MSRQTLTLRVNAAGSWAKLARIDADDLPVAAQLLDAILQIAHGRVKFDAITDSGEHLPPIDTHGLRSRIAWDAWLNRRPAAPTITTTPPTRHIAWTGERPAPPSTITLTTPPTAPRTPEDS